MKTFMVIVSLLFAGTSYANAGKFCLPDLGGCVLSTPTTIYVPESIKSQVTPETTSEFKRAGILIADLTPFIEQRLTPLVNYSGDVSTQEAQNQIDAAGIDAIESGAGCAGGILGCVTATYGALGMPVMMFAVKVGCGIVGVQCAVAKVKYDKWQKLREIEMSKVPHANGGNGAGGSGGDPTPGSGGEGEGGSGGVAPRVVEKCSATQVTTTVGGKSVQGPKRISCWNTIE